jgi:hypothetical protein
VYNSLAKYLEGEENSLPSYGVFLQCNISLPALLILFEETNDLVVDINDHLPKKSLTLKISVKSGD